MWAFINNPTKIGQCLPGAKGLTVEDENRFAVSVPVGVGFIKTDFKFKIEILEKSPISRVRLRAVGSGSGSSVTIDTLVELKDIPDGTELAYSSDAKVAGMMASLGQRLIKDTADKTVSGVFTCVKQQVE